MFGAQLDWRSAEPSPAQAARSGLGPQMLSRRVYRRDEPWPPRRFQRRRGRPFPLETRLVSFIPPGPSSVHAAIRCPNVAELSAEARKSRKKTPEEEKNLILWLSGDEAVD